MSDQTSAAGAPSMRGTYPPEDVFPDNRHVTAAHAAERGDAAAVRASLARPGAEGAGPAGIDDVSPVGINLLMYEIVCRNELAVRTLLEARANPNHLTPKGLSPIATAGGADERTYLLLLLGKGGDPNLKNQHGEPLLHQLVYTGKWDNLHLLLERGADINAVDERGHTALLRLVASNQFDEALQFIDRGADPDIVGKDGVTVRRLVETSLDAPASPQSEWRRRLADRLGVELADRAPPPIK
jgi:ankyrin repeat protein